MKFLRTVSTRRLLAMIAGLIVAVAAGTAIAVAAAGSGPLPRRKPLAQAIRAALGAPAVRGISARIRFTNHLIDSTDIQGSDPILTGATGRLWLSSNHQMRLELQGDNGDAQVVVHNRSFWIYDPSSNTAYEGKLPASAGKPAADKRAKGKSDRLPTVAQIQSDLGRVMKHVDLSSAIPSDVAGQAAYTIRVSPKHDGGLLGAGELAWDAARGVPRRVAVYASGDSTPVLELKATDISYGPVPASDFPASPPAGAKVVKVSTPAASGDTAATSGRGAKHRGRKAHVQLSGVAAVSRRVPFKLLAPSTLVGLPRRSVTLLDWGGSPAALVAYGQNLGGIAVIEQTGPSKAAQSSASGTAHQHGLSLPTVSVKGVTGQELDTALGTMIRFSTRGVSYTVLGSVPPAAADAAARAL